MSPRALTGVEKLSTVIGVRTGIAKCETESQWNLNAERLNRGLTIPAFAAEIGVAPWVVRGALLGRRPTPHNAYKIATYIGAKVTDIWPLEEA